MLVFSYAFSGAIPLLAASFFVKINEVIFSTIPVDQPTRQIISWLLIGFREEGLKLFVLLAIAWRDPEMRDSSDRLLAATAIAVGFGIYENLIYLAPGGSYRAIVVQSTLRMAMAVPIHVLASILTATIFILSISGRRVWLVFLVVPAFLHSLWDAPWELFGHEISWIASLAVIVALSTLTPFLYRRIIPTTQKASRSKMIIAGCMIAVVLGLCADEILAAESIPGLPLVTPYTSFIRTLVPWLMFGLEILV